MKQALIVSITEVKTLRPKLETRSRTICFSDVEKGRKFVDQNKQKITHVQLAELED